MSRGSDLRRVIGWSAALLALGGVAGLAWFWLAEPGEWEVTELGLSRSEDEVRAQFAVIVRFVVIGAVLCFGWGWAAGHRLRDVGWLLAPVFALVPGLAAVIAWQVGVVLGPSDPAEAVNLALGDRVPAQLEIDAIAAFLVWPMFALAGLVLAAWLDRSNDAEPAEDVTADLG